MVPGKKKIMQKVDNGMKSIRQTFFPVKRSLPEMNIHNASNYLKLERYPKGLLFPWNFECP